MNQSSGHFARGANPREDLLTNVATFGITHGSVIETRLRWEDFESKRSIAQPKFLMRIEGGGLDAKLGEGGVLELDGQTFDELPGLEPPFHLYRAR